MSLESADAFQLGPGEDFRAFVVRNHEALKNAARRLVRNDPRERPTSIVNETVLRLLKSEVEIFGEAQGFALFSMRMRWIVIERAKKRREEERRFERLPAGFDFGVEAGEQPDLEQVHNVLLQLKQLDEDKWRVVELHVYCGHPHATVAELVNVSLSTVESHWKFAKAWILAQLRKAS